MGLEQNVVIGLRVKRWIKINEIDAFGNDVVPQDVEVVSIVKVIYHSLVSSQVFTRLCQLYLCLLKTSAIIFYEATRDKFSAAKTRAASLRIECQPRRRRPPNCASMFSR
jgi:hypothetical protein